MFLLYQIQGISILSIFKLLYTVDLVIALVGDGMRIQSPALTHSLVCYFRFSSYLTSVSSLMIPIHLPGYQNISLIFHGHAVAKQVWTFILHCANDALIMIRLIISEHTNRWLRAFSKHYELIDDHARVQYVAFSSTIPFGSLNPSLPTIWYMIWWTISLSMGSSIG